MTTHVESFTGPGTDQPWTTFRDAYAWTLNGDGTGALLNEGGSTYQRLDESVDALDQFAEVVLPRTWSDTTAGDPRVVLLLRMGTGTAQTYYACSLQLTNQTLQWLYWSSGVPTPFGPAQSVDLGTSGPATFRVECEGSTFRAYVNGTLAVTTTDAGRNTGDRVGTGVQRGTTIRFDEFRGGALADVVDPDPDPDPEPGGGALAVLDAYSDTGSAGGAHDLSVTAPAVSAEQGLLAVVTSIYNGDDLTPSGGDANPWQQIGAQLGANDGEANQRVAAYVLATTGTEADRTVTVSTTNESSLTLLHLDGPPTVEGVADHTVPRASSPAAQQTVGPVEVPEAGGLLVGVWAGVQFSGSLVWEPDDAGLTVQQRPDMGGVTGALIATEYVTTGPASRTASATGEPVPDAGYAGKLLVLSGPAVEPPPDGPEPGRFLLAVT